MSLFDAPLHHNLSQASIHRASYDLRNIYHESLIRVKPDLAVTFVDNHDTQPLQSLEEFTEQWFKPHAYALILLRKEGYPCVFYADLYGARYSGKNKDGVDCDIELPPLGNLPALLELRKNYAYGEQEDYFDDPNCVGWVRKGSADRPGSGFAALLCNHSSCGSVKKMLVGADKAMKHYYDFLGNEKGTITVDEEGYGYFPVGPSSVSVWVIKNE